MNEFKISGHIVDIHQRRIFPGELRVREGIIESIREVDGSVPSHFIMPGFVDAHIHIESSMLVPSEFARLAVQHGTVATVSDPHEIGNVLGVAGVEYMIENGNSVPFKFHFGAPSCVPATTFETAGATIDLDDISQLMERPEILYLSEMMNWPGVLQRKPLVMDKIKAAQKAGKPIDGHAPGLKGKDALRYASAGISTDHECYSIEEARDKLNAGMKVIIREGSAARNFDSLIPLMTEYADSLMFCSDDKHPDELIAGHIDELVRKAVAMGYDLFDVLTAACYNPVAHYGLAVGTVREGDPGDFIVVRSLDTFDVIATYIAGEKVYADRNVLFSTAECKAVNRFECAPLHMDSILMRQHGNRLRVIVAQDRELVTKSAWYPVKRNSMGDIVSDVEADVLKIVIVNRYQTAAPAVAFVHGFGIKTGAIASTIAHDSHNIIAVGVDDDSIIRAINTLIEEQGGICVVGPDERILPLPVAGLMSTLPGEEVAREYQLIDQATKRMGSSLRAPFMTLSFMALLVIPELKLSDKGLFDGSKFEFVNMLDAVQ